MSGIVGIIGNGNVSGLRAGVHEMVECMRYENGYRSGALALPEMEADLGWVQGSCAGDLPAWNDRKDICILFAGEHFGREEQIKGLRKFGFEGDINQADWLVRLYEQVGSRFFELLNGSFSGVLVDKREGKIFVFNDRFGLNRIYYHQAKDGFYFSSEAKALLKVLPHLRQLDLEGLGEFVSCGCALQNRTLFHNIFLLPPASAWIFKRKQLVEKHTYFQASAWENQPPLSLTNWYEQLKDIFSRVLERYFEGTEQIGMSLTGGLDGRMIMAWSAKKPGELPCYTFGGCYRDSADVQIARRVAHACEQPHQVISVGDEFIRSFPALAERAVYVSDGAMDVTGAAELYVNRFAGKIAPVRLTGNYGSEILRSNVAFRPQAISGEFFDAALVEATQRAAITYAEEARGNRRSFIAFKQVPWHHFARSAVEKSQLTVRSPYLDNDLVALGFRAPPGKEAKLNASLRLIADGCPALGRIPTDRGIKYPATKLGNRIRRSVEEFRAKAEYAYDYGMPGWVTRVDSFLTPLHLDRLFLGRQKFYHFRIWYREQLGNYVKDILLDPRSRSRPYLRGQSLEPMVMAHLKGEANFTILIHKLLSMELLQRLLIDRS